MFKALRTALAEFSKGTLATIGMAFGVVAMNLLQKYSETGDYELLLAALGTGAIAAGFFGLFAYLVEKQAQG